MIMHVRSVGDEMLGRAGGFLFQQIYPAGGEDLVDWGVGRSVVEPGGGTTPHRHEENEMFLVSSGTARVEVGGEVRDVSAGEVLLVPFGSQHRITNASADERLVFLNVYWPESMARVEL